MKILKLKFVDFWGDYNKIEGNIFCDLLSQSYILEFSDDPDILFFSCFGNEHIKYRCLKIFFAAENQKANYFACDYSITFENIRNPKNLRLPLWVSYYYSYKTWSNIDLPDFSTSSDEDLLLRWKKKKKFCCFIVSNNKSKKRNKFFKKLNTIKHVDSAGRYLNNIGRYLEGGTIEKFKFISDYKFVLSFENEKSDVYITEKVFEPLLVGSIPIYWGANNLDIDFNPDRILYLKNDENEEKFIEKILEIDSNDDLALKMLRQGCFTEKNASLAEYCSKTKLFLQSIIEAKPKKRVSNNLFKKKIYEFYLIYLDIKKKLRHKLNLK